MNVLGSSELDGRISDRMDDQHWYSGILEHMPDSAPIYVSMMVSHSWSQWLHLSSIITQPFNKLQQQLWTAVNLLDCKICLKLISDSMVIYQLMPSAGIYGFHHSQIVVKNLRSKTTTWSIILIRPISSINSKIKHRATD